jgi:hypothetical protein
MVGRYPEKTTMRYAYNFFVSYNDGAKYVTNPIAEKTCNIDDAIFWLNMLKDHYRALEKRDGRCYVVSMYLKLA